MTNTIRRYSSRPRALVAIGLVLIVTPARQSAVAAGAERATTPTRQPASFAAQVEQGALHVYANLPLAFVANAGQIDARVRYFAQTADAGFYFTPNEAVFAFGSRKKGLALRLAFVGASRAPTLVGTTRGGGTVNYLIGRDPAKWRTGVPTYREIVYRDLWPGIDLAFHGERGELKYEFRLAPAADPRDIRLAYRGARRLSLDTEGRLVIHTALGIVRDSRPVSYQMSDGRRVPVASEYAPARSSFGFAVGAYDATRPLVIDPGLVYSTYLGGRGSGTDARTGIDEGLAIAVDAAGSVYVTGSTNSPSFPTTAGAFDATYESNPNASPDAFVTKLNPLGTGLDYSTYLGGSATDVGAGIAVDAAGYAFVTGRTASANFPTTPGAFDTSYNIGGDAFVVKLNPSGTALEYSTYLGGSGIQEADAGWTDSGEDIAIDGAGNAYVSGRTNSFDFPTTVGAFDRTYGRDQDAFVTKLNATGSALMYSTYLGGGTAATGCCTIDVAVGIAVDASNNAYVTGTTTAANFPTTPGAFDRARQPAAGADAFVTKLSAAGALLYSTFLGGNGEDLGLDIALDGAGNACVTGRTASADFPTTPGAFDTSYNGGADAFVTKLDPTDLASIPLLYSTYLGGASLDEGRSLALDANGHVHVTGVTASAGFPTTAGAFDATISGVDAFVTKLDPTASVPLRYSTFLGGGGNEDVFGIAVDRDGRTYVTGETSSTNFPTTPGAYDRTINSLPLSDAFVTKLDTVGTPHAVTLTPAAHTNPVGTSHTVTALVEDAGRQPNESVTVRFSVTGSVTTSGSCTTGTDGQCSFTYQGPTAAGSDTIEAFADTNSNNAREAGEPAGSATKEWVSLDQDGDGITDDADNCPATANPDQIDTDVDGQGNACDADDDNDGVADANDAFPLDPGEWADADGDGIGNNADPDDDNDGVADTNDAFPLDSSESVDTDRDGVGNNADADDDNDGVADTNDAFPLDSSESVDSDRDGIGNNADPDDDNDGVPDTNDAFPLDSSESVDSDRDGIGNNADADDDNDGIADTNDAFPLDPNEATDTDRDGIGNNADPDDDNDGVADTNDAFPLDPNEATDTDRDGIGNNADADDDNDGVADTNDAFPLDPSESVDTDRDGIGNNADADDDNDGVPDLTDAFPQNPSESRDSDGDGTGDNADPDDDNDGVPDIHDAFPFDPARALLIAVTPPSHTDAVSTQHCVTATVTGALEQAVPGVIVRFTVIGSVNTAGAFATDANGQAVFCYTGPALPGADGITAHADTDGDGAVDPAEPVVTATKSWLLPAATPGQVTGGGHAPTRPGTDAIAFGFNAKSTDRDLTGHCNVIDQAARVHVKCLDVTSLVRNGTSAMIFGNGTINGERMFYRIDVEDLGEPGAGDTFRIITDNGYAAGGILAGGNVQVR